jgi:hypothetical protein
MEKHAWVDSFPGSITVCDREGLLIEMNPASQEVFKEDGGLGLLGTGVLDCHPEPSRSKLSQHDGIPTGQYLHQRARRAEEAGLPGALVPGRPIRRFCGADGALARRPAPFHSR